MKNLRSRFVVLSALLAGLGSASSQPAATAATDAEEAYRRNNIGVALLEQYRHQEAAEAFRSALVASPDLSIARFNLALALFHVPDLAGSLREARSAAPGMPDSPHPHYLLGLIAKAENRTEDAKAAFSRVLELDPGDVGANVNLGQLLVQLRQYDEAIAMLRRASEEEPFNATAVYNLGMALTRSGDREGGRERIQRFQELRASGYGTLLGQAYLEQGRYAEAINTTGAEADLVNGETPDVRYVDVTAAWLGEAAAGGARVADSLGRTVETPGPRARRELAEGLGGQLVLFDADADGDLDLLAVGPEGRRLLVNEGGKLRDRGADAGWPVERPALAAVAADYDNDTFPDLYFFEHSAGSLYRNDGAGRFADVTSAAGIPADRYLSVSGAFADADHDGDVDLLVAGFADLGEGGGRFPEGFAAAPNRLYRNDGDGTFTDVSRETGLSAVPGHALAVVPTDYDNRRDVDFVFARHGGPPLLMRNFRDGAFRDVSGEVGFTVPGAFTAAAAGDVNKDGYTDFYFAERGGTGRLALSDGQLGFETRPGPDAARDAQAAQFLDYDNDGLLDLATAGPGGLRIFRNLGDRFGDVSASAIGTGPSLGDGRVALASGDLDRDGDTDLVVRGARGALSVLRNDGAERRPAVSVRLVGRVSNRSGVGSKLEVRAGSLSQKLETYAATPAPAPADILFGLGVRDGADAVRVLWPAGILQTEIGGGAAGSRVASRLEVEELDRKPSSCPYLFTWNGRAFEFVTDFMGGGEMGYWHAPGVRNHPDPEEYVRIRSDQLVEREGSYELRITNELEEALFLDGLRLHVVQHPEGTHVFPNEGMVSEPPPFELYALEELRPVRSARDDRGRDVSRYLAAADRSYVEGFGLLSIRGYAEEHALVLDLGPEAQDPVLLLTGWTDYAFSSDNVAASQRGLALAPPRLEVRDEDGRWQTALPEIGVPVGRPQTVVVDLSGRWRGPSREVRIVTNMRIYWDQAQVAPGRLPGTASTARVLAPSGAELRWRGFSRETSPDGREPWDYAYASVSWSSPWKVLPGRYTREGDVLELLAPRDDMFVISRPGDEIAVRFDAGELPVLPSGWTRTFLLYTDGFSKEMDVNSSNPDELGPLPFHAMTRYPYGDEQSYPLTPERLEYMERYNTRVVSEPLPRLAWEILAAGREPDAPRTPQVR
jgi:Flp pilus assembly protein TadD